MTNKIKNDGRAKRESIDDLAARLAALDPRATRELEEKIRLARGTREDVKAPESEPALSLEQRIEAALRAAPLSLDALARSLAVPIGRVAKAIKPLRKQLFNVGTEHEPEWFWRCGDDVSTPVVNAAVLALVKCRPLFTSEIVAATGARPKRIDGALVAIQEHDMKSGVAHLLKLGDLRRPKWWYAPDQATVARLTSREKRS